MAGLWRVGGVSCWVVEVCWAAEVCCGWLSTASVRLQPRGGGGGCGRDGIVGVREGGGGGRAGSGWAGRDGDGDVMCVCEW